MKIDGETLNVYYQVKKKHSEKAMCYMSPTIWHSGKSKIIRQENDQSLPGVGQWGGMNRSQRTFRIVKILCVIL